MTDVYDVYSVSSHSVQKTKGDLWSIQISYDIRYFTCYRNTDFFVTCMGLSFYEVTTLYDY